MSFVKKTWVDRQSEYPTRRVLTPTGANHEYDVSRSEGVILEKGDAFDAATMNDLEQRIETGLTQSCALCTATFAVDGWQAGKDGTFTQTAEMPGVTADSAWKSAPMCRATGDPSTNATLRRALGCINAGYASLGDGSVTVTVTRKPDCDIPVTWCLEVTSV